MGRSPQAHVGAPWLPRSSGHLSDRGPDCSPQERLVTSRVAGPGQAGRSLSEAGEGWGDLKRAFLEPRKPDLEYLEGGCLSYKELPDAVAKENAFYLTLLFFSGSTDTQPELASEGGGGAVWGGAGALGPRRGRWWPGRSDGWGEDHLGAPWPILGGS